MKPDNSQLNNGVTILGLGPGDPESLTVRASEILENTKEIWLRTSQHPVVAAFPESIDIHSFDDLYQTAENFEFVYAQIVNEIIDLGQRPGGVVYAVPGHPLVAEATCPEIVRRAQQIQLRVDVIPGLSFLEPILSALNLDMFPQTTLMDALELSLLNVPPFPPSAPVIIAQIHSRMVASDVKLTLNSIYPDEHPVILVHAAGTEHQLVEELNLFELDRSQHFGLLSSLYVPALEPDTSFELFQEVIARLRAPDGCPWDREQTHLSLRQYLLEETYEALDALDAEDPQAMMEEFGDILLQVVLHAQIASESGDFAMADILKSVNRKIVRRHPHVFGSLKTDDTNVVLQNWERLKAEERQEKGQDKKGLLDGVALALPALVQARQYLSRAARLGFDWQDITFVVAKVQEELNEVYSAEESKRESEIGDLLFAIANLARWYDIDPESALRSANQRFKARFSYLENWAKNENRSLENLTINEMLDVWAEAKLHLGQD